MRRILSPLRTNPDLNILNFDVWGRRWRLPGLVRNHHVRFGIYRFFRGLQQDKRFRSSAAPKAALKPQVQRTSPHAEVPDRRGRHGNWGPASRSRSPLENPHTAPPPHPSYTPSPPTHFARSPMALARSGRETKRIQILENQILFLTAPPELSDKHRPEAPQRTQCRLPPQLFPNPSARVRLPDVSPTVGYRRLRIISQAPI